MLLILVTGCATSTQGTTSDFCQIYRSFSLSAEEQFLISDEAFMAWLDNQIAWDELCLE